MNRITLLLLFLAQVASGQSGVWTWAHGDSTMNSNGNAGTIGVPAPSNNPPAVYEPVYWVDSQDQLWIYGGYNPNGNLYQALWRFNPYTNLWTWMQGSLAPNQYAVYGTQGIPSPSNTPGSRNCALAWIDTSGTFWLMGGYIPQNFVLGDLWKLDTATLEWTWMSGSNTVSAPNTLVLGVPSSVNHPRSITETSCAWTDPQNNLWLYGGLLNYYLDFFDQVIRYNISTNEWTWVRGSNTSNIPPSYGVQGIPAPGNTPGSRAAYAHWQDTSGNFWMMNGSTVGIQANDHNDVWRYNPSTDEWTWMSGTQLQDDTGTYQSYCDLSGNNQPASRGEDKSVYRDTENRVWMFGGTTANSNDDYQDLWVYSPDSLNYQWMHGSNLVNQPGVYGQLNVPSPANIPTGRDGALLFGDSLCHTFLFGGIRRHPLGGFNDVWKFVPDTNCIPCNQAFPSASFSAPSPVCPGICTDFTNLSQNASSYQWYFPGAVPLSSTVVNPSGICYNTPGTYDVTLIAANANGSDTLTIPNYITVHPFPPAQTIFQSGDTLFSNAGFTSYQWFYNGDTIPGATGTFYVAMQSGDYSLICFDTNGCIVEVVVLNVTAGIAQAGLDSRASVFPNPVADKLIIRLTQGQRSSIRSCSVLSSLGEIILKDETGSSVNDNGENDHAINVSALSPGIYFVEVRTEKRSLRARFVKQ